jgi:hypothetical protein
MGALPGHPVQARRLQPFRGGRHETHEIVSMIVAQDEDDVARGGSLLGLCRRGHARGERHQ